MHNGCGLESSCLGRRTECVNAGKSTVMAAYDRSVGSASGKGLIRKLIRRMTDGVRVGVAILNRDFHSALCVLEQQWGVKCQKCGEWDRGD